MGKAISKYQYQQIANTDIYKLYQKAHKMPIFSFKAFFHFTSLYFQNAIFYILFHKSNEYTIVSIVLVLSTLQVLSL